MDLSSNGIHLQKVLHEICSFFMRIFKDNEIPSLPEFVSINELYPNEQKFKVISFLISAAIDVFSNLSSKNIKLLVGNKMGLWRTLLVRLCLLNGADIHHLPLEIDIVASRNKLAIDSLIFNWPFCNNVISDLLEYLCDSFHGTNNVGQPYIDDYIVKFKQAHKRTEIIKCIAICIKWVHAIQNSPSYNYTKDVLKDNVITLVLVSDVVMKNREGQFDETWSEICAQMETFDEFDPNRIDSYPLYCALNSLLKTFSDFMRSLISEDSNSDCSKILSSLHDLSEKYESREHWASELTSTLLAALNTVMSEVLFRKCKSFPKKSENNLKMFISSVAISESISLIILMSEVNYWIDRLKRKKVELPYNIDDFCPAVWSKNTKESIFISNLEKYFLNVLQNDVAIKHVPSLIGAKKIISDSKSFEKLIINSLKSATNALLRDEPYTPPILESKVTIISQIIDRMAEYYALKLGAHFHEKISRIIEKINTSILVSNPIVGEMDEKSFIVPLLDEVDYKVIVTYIWKCVNLSNNFMKPISIQEFLIDIRHELFSQIQVNEADRIISRLMFFVGWRFKYRATVLSSDELFHFNLVFNFLGENLTVKPLIQQNLSFWMRMLSSFDHSKYNTPIEFKIDEFFHNSKIDAVKNHILQIFRGVKNISIPSLSDLNFPKSKRGLESTKAMIFMMRQVFGKLNDNVKHKNDNVNYWLKNIKAVETELSIICCRLDGDLNQILGELNYLAGIIRGSIFGDTDLKENKNGRESDVINDEKDKSFNGTLKSVVHMKTESTSNHEKSSKRKNSSRDDSSERSNKMPRRSRSYQFDEDIEPDVKWIKRDMEKTTLQSKVNFIDNSIDAAPGDLIESRICYISQPTTKSICIDVGKGKLRPARYVEIESSPFRNPLTILKRPNVCAKRNNTKSHKQNEFTSLFNFKLIRQVGQGSFGKVFEAVDKFSNIRVALKRTTLQNAEDGVPQSILREILLHRSNNHCNIIQFLGIVVDEIKTIKSSFSGSETIVPKSFYFVFEYIEHDLYGLMKSKSMIFSFEQIGFLSKQLFSALSHLHERNIAHRDVTPSNLMITNRGILKLADFGNARYLTKDVIDGKSMPMTPKVVSYLYRAPEILLDFPTHGTEIDIWSAGVVIFEVLTGTILFSTNMPLDESCATMMNFIEYIANIIGSPSQLAWPAVNESKHYLALATKGISINYSRKIDEYMTTIPSDAADVLKNIFLWDPKKRIDAKGALKSDWLQSVEMHAMLPTEFPDKDCHEFLLENWNDEVGLDIWAEEQRLEMNMDVQDSSTTQNGACKADSEMEQEEEDLCDEDLKPFVNSLSGKILELNDILDRLRKEPAYTAEICKGVIMRAAREWSDREKMRLKMVPFMLNYLLRRDEKDKLHF